MVQDEGKIRAKGRGLTGSNGKSGGDESRGLPTPSRLLLKTSKGDLNRVIACTAPVERVEADLRETVAPAVIRTDP